MLNRVFRWLVNLILMVMGIVYVALVTKAVIDNIIYPQREQPIIIDDVRLGKTTVESGAQLPLIISGSIANSHCSQIYVLGSIVDEQNKVVQLDKVITFDKKGLEGLLVDHTPLNVTMPILTPGIYQFRVEIHEICGSQSFIILAPLVAFSVEAT